MRTPDGKYTGVVGEVLKLEPPHRYVTTFKFTAFDDATDRLENSGSFNSMVSHRVRVSKVSDVDSELITWLKKA